MHYFSPILGSFLGPGGVGAGGGGEPGGEEEAERKRGRRRGRGGRGEERGEGGGEGEEVRDGPHVPPKNSRCLAAIFVAVHLLFVTA